MEIHCKIIEDLLPLYAEGLVSKETTDAVDAHLTKCDACKHKLQDLQAPAHLIPAPTDSLQRVRRELRKRRAILGIFCILLTASLLLGVFIWMYQPIYLSSREAVADVIAEDNTVTVYFTPQAERCWYREEVDFETGIKSVTLEACKRRWDLYRDESNTPSPKTFENVSQVWFAAAPSEQEDALLWSNGPISGGRLSLPWLGMRFYSLLSLVTGTLCAVIWLFFRKKKLGKLALAAAVFLLCYAVCAVYSTGGPMLIYASQDRPVIFFLTGLLAALVAGTILAGIQLYLTKKKDKTL